jgi:hypothetical protein
MKTLDRLNRLYKPKASLLIAKENAIPVALIERTGMAF